MTPSMRTSAWACWFLTTIAALANSGPIAAQAPRPGDVEQRTVITLCLQVGSTDRESRRVTYTPPPGWYVRSHSVHCKRKYGQASYAVTTVPRDWGWSSTENANESSRALLDLAGQSGHAGLKAHLNLEQEQKSAEQRQFRSSHHALVLDATVKGEGFLRAGGSLDLTVTAELVFLGTIESSGKTVPDHSAAASKPLPVSLPRYARPFMPPAALNPK